MDHGYGGGGHGGGAEDTVTLGDLFALVERRLRLVVLTIVALGLAAFVFLGTRTPQYRADATLLLLDDDMSGGLLEGLALFGSTRVAASEIALIKSRSMIEATIASPPTPRNETRVFEPTEPDSVLVGDMRRLGLTTVVQSRDLTPFSILWAKLRGVERPSHRLFVEAEGPTEPAVLHVAFEGADTVVLEDASSGETLERPFSPGEKFEAFGLKLRLSTAGDHADRSYRVRRLEPQLAVERVLEGLVVRETARNAGVIEVSVTDSDPNRAAELANALCQNYILRSIRLGSYRASQTVDFVSEQLEAQLEALREAEHELVALQSRSPTAIDVGASAQALIDRLSDLELARTRSALARTALGEAADLLERGDLEAIARLSQEVPDLESLVFIEEIGKLTAESLLLGRRDSGAFRLLLEQESVDLRGRIDEARVLEASVRNARKGLAQGDSGGLLALSAEDVVPTAYATRLAELDAEIGAIAGSVTPTHPDLVQLLQARAQLLARLGDELEDLAGTLAREREDREGLLAAYSESMRTLGLEEKDKLDQAVAALGMRMLANLRSRVSGLAAEEEALGDRIAALEAELGALPEAERAVAEPLRRVEALTEIVQFLLKSQQEAQLTEAATLPSAVLIDPALPPRTRSSPRLVLSLVVATLLAGVIGIGLAFLRQSLSGCMYSSAELEEATGLPVFGAIPDFRRGRLRIRGAREGYLPMLREPGGIIAEAYRSLRANLKFSLEKDTGFRTLAVTSCAPGEGKTTTNTDLAIAFAQGGTRVLLVDADFRRPTVHSYFALEQSPGFAEAIVDDADWRSLVHRTEVDRLDVLCAGDYRGAPGEALSSERPQQLIDAFANEYDLVMFDLPPAIVVADVEVFAHKLDALVLLYRSGGVPREALQTAVRRVQTSGAKLFGLVLNAVRPTRTGSRSYYSYGYDQKKGRGKG